MYIQIFQKRISQNQNNARKSTRVLPVCIQIFQNQKRFLKIVECKKVNKSTHHVYSDFSKPKNARKSTRVLTVCIQMVDHIRRKCGRPLSRLVLHYHYLIMSKYQLSHHHCHHDYYHWPTLGVSPSLSLLGPMPPFGRQT